MQNLGIFSEKHDFDIIFWYTVREFLVFEPRIIV